MNNLNRGVPIFERRMMLVALILFGSCGLSESNLCGEDPTIGQLYDCYLSHGMTPAQALEQTARAWAYELGYSEKVANAAGQEAVGSGVLRHYIPAPLFCKVSNHSSSGTAPSVKLGHGGSFGNIRSNRSSSSGDRRLPSRSR